MTEFIGQTAIVVGGGSGIGKAVASALVRRGARVVCFDRNGAAAESTVAALGDSALAVTGDVAIESEVEDGFEQGKRWLGGLSILINCAAVTGKTGVVSHELSIDDFDAVTRVNLRGAFIASVVGLRLMLPHGYGRILHVASIAGKEGNAGMVAYSATKAGVIGMVKSQGKEYAQSGITINALAPAVIRTEMVAAMPEHQVEYMTSRIPMGRCGTLDEVADLICWIVSPACSYTTGFTFDMSGGRAVY